MEGEGSVSTVEGWTADTGPEDFLFETCLPVRGRGSQEKFTFRRTLSTVPHLKVLRDFDGEGDGPSHPHPDENCDRS